MSDAISKRIKQLELQNLKFKKLLESTLQITDQQTAKDLELKNETEFLKQAVSQLEEQKNQLENDLKRLQSQNLEAQDCSKLQILLDDHVDIQSKLMSSLNDIKRESLEIQQLKTDDENLKQVISKLKIEKEQLLEEILQVKKANEENNRLACENLKLRQQLALLEQEPSTKTASNKNASGEDLVSRLASIENLKEILQNELRDSKASKVGPLNLSTENTVLELKISGLEKQKQKLLKQLKTTLLKSANEMYELHSNTSDGQLRNLINELDIHKTVLLINLSNIKEMKSHDDQKKCQEDEKKCEENKTKKENNILKNNNQCLVEYCNLSCPVENLQCLDSHQDADPSNDIKKDLVNSLNQQINVKSFLQFENESTKPDPSEASDSGLKSNSDHLSVSSFPSNSSEMIQEVIDIRDDNRTSNENIEILSDEELSVLDQEIHDLPTVSEEDEPKSDLIVEHMQLKEAVDRLEKERLLLLEQLQNINAATVETWGNALYDRFTNDESSEHLRRLPLDDATNQMYANEEQLLEQRIRELEEDNERIRRDLTALMKEAQSEAILETGEKLIRENRGSLGDS